MEELTVLYPYSFVKLKVAKQEVLRPFLISV